MEATVAMQRAIQDRRGVLSASPVGRGADLSTICHDVLSALAVVTINVELLASSGETEEMMAAGADAREGVQRIAKIVRELQVAARSSER